MTAMADDELRVAVSAAIEQWKTSRQLSHLSPNDCETLNKLIITGLQTVLSQRAKAFDKALDELLDQSRRNSTTGRSDAVGATDLFSSLRSQPQYSGSPMSTSRPIEATTRRPETEVTALPPLFAFPRASVAFKWGSTYAATSIDAIRVRTSLANSR